MNGSEGEEIGGWVLQRRDHQMGLIVARLVGGSEGGDGDKIGL